MQPFKKLNQEELRNLVQGQENVLSPIVKQEETFLQRAVCPTCNASTHERFVNSKSIFSPGKTLQNTLLRCLKCDTEWEPHSNIVVRLTNSALD